MEAIGIDVGGTNLRVARVDSGGSVAVTLSARTTGDPVAALAEMGRLAREIDTPAVVGMGVGIPGRVDVAARQVLSGGFLDLSRVDLAAALERETGKRVVLDGDANLALLAEWRFGAARGTRNVVMITIGTGIGGAALLGGRLLRGRMSGGQFGHVTVEADGHPCNCGRSGCVETTSSGTALRRLITEAGMPADTRIEALLDRARKGDGAALAIVKRWVLPLRSAIDSLVAVLDPECVVLGGGLGSAAAAAIEYAPALSPWYQSRVTAAELGDAAGVIGGAVAAMEPDLVSP
jgi:glucokinase